RVVLRALAKNPGHRFQSAQQFADHLVEAVKGHESGFEPPSDLELEDETLPRRSPPALGGREAAGADLPSVVRVPEPAPPGPSWLLPPPSNSDELPNELKSDRVPTLLLEHPPRTRLYLGMAALVLIMMGTIGYLLTRDWELARADEVGRPDPTNLGDLPARTQTDGVQASRQVMIKGSARSDSESETKPGPDLAVKTSSSVRAPKSDAAFPMRGVSERAEREVRGIYTDWVLAAMRGDWTRHMSFYGDTVEYFSNGTIPRSAVDLRKRRIFSGLDSYSLRFSESPQVALRNFNGLREADVIFSKQWELRRGRKRVKGEARGLITLRHDSRGWRIVSERQIKK
ncbi:MAG TPA: hypothetical protein VJ302_14010, partial [Blastocatellia bacterium]|nr:hypothetical protein [Blastocatellia bacterium]